MFHENKVCNETFIHMQVICVLLRARSYRCAVDSDSLATAKEWSIEKPCSGVQRLSSTCNGRRQH